MFFRQSQDFRVVSLLLACLFISHAAQAELPDRLVYKSASNIQDAGAGLTEPSGLRLSAGKNSLWTISDSTSKLFQLKFNGDLIKRSILSGPGLRGLEGIAISNDGKYLYVVTDKRHTLFTYEVK